MFQVLIGDPSSVSALTGFYYPPTVLIGNICSFARSILSLDVEQDWPIVQEEVFGPIVTIQKFHSDDEVRSSCCVLIFELGACSRQWR